ncbi:MAG: energy-coupling factor ABC transporter permease [Phycisphaerae bacterium]|jgi:cobalt/nickel transport system permease protein
MPGLILGMHAPDGLFSMPVNIVFAIAVALLLAGAMVSLSRRGDHRLVPMMGIMAAFIFAGQMVNFPIASGTTGHLLGGTLAAVLLGPWAGTVVMAAVVFFQALLGDGGLTVLGPNIFNMGVIGTCGGYFVYRAVLGKTAMEPRRIVAGSYFAAWISVVLASIFASLQLAVSGTVGLDRALPAMVGTHMFIGVGEALITASVVAFVLKTRPELLYGFRTGVAAPRPVGRAVVVCGLAASLVVALFLSLLPTLWDYPDGLEYVGMEKGFIVEEAEHDDAGGLLTLPAYALGVRLETQDGRVTVAHAYGSLASPLKQGDVVERIGGVPVTDLTSAEEALNSHDSEKQTAIDVAIRRDSAPMELSVNAAVAPDAGAHEPLVALLPDYTVPGVEGLLSTSLAGAIGTVVMFLASSAVGWGLMRPSRLARVVAAQNASDGD